MGFHFQYFCGKNETGQLLKPGLLSQHFPSVQDPDRSLTMFSRLSTSGNNLIIPQHCGPMFPFLSLQPNVTALSHNMGYNRNMRDSKLMFFMITMPDDKEIKAGCPYSEAILKLQH